MLVLRLKRIAASVGFRVALFAPVGACSGFIAQRPGADSGRCLICAAAVLGLFGSDPARCHFDLLVLSTVLPLLAKTNK
jgi:hypothetical protein